VADAYCDARRDLYEPVLGVKNSERIPISSSATSVLRRTRTAIRRSQLVALPRAKAARRARRVAGRQRGIVRGRRGPDGGYQLAVDPRRLNLAEIVESLGGPLFPFPCLERGSGDHPRCSECPGESRCIAERALRRASAAAYESLESITIFDLIETLDSAHEPATDPGSPSELRPKRAQPSRPALTPLRTKRQQP
jgi:hypothetical protein